MVPPLPDVVDFVLDFFLTPAVPLIISFVSTIDSMSGSWKLAWPSLGSGAVPLLLLRRLRRARMEWGSNIKRVYRTN